MKITDVAVQTFRYTSNEGRDAEGHGHPADPHEARMTIMTVTTDQGAAGHSFGANPAHVAEVVKPNLVGEDPLYRERIWHKLYTYQRGNSGVLSDRLLALVDLALWDIAGQFFKTPVYKLLGASRDRVLAYGSTMCGDEMPNGLSTPEEYGRFAEWMVEKRGYRAVKLHTWMPPIKWAPDPKMDVRACAAVREAVGPDVECMLDCYHYYSREDAFYIGKELQKLNYKWLEEPMDEYSVSSYAWLARQLEIPIIGPEYHAGKMQSRAEWIVRGASDITRGGVMDNGGITPLMKIAHLAEAFNIAMEVHSPGAANLHVLGAMSHPGQYYERGLLHPFVDYEKPQPWLKSIDDPMDQDGYVSVPQGPGLGQDIDFEYIRANLVR
jgi:L-alanine-DL-glutamate epimerase-like enolase superfamily enzyme